MVDVDVRIGTATLRGQSVKVTDYHDCTERNGTFY